MLAEILPPTRHCLWCGEDIDGRKKTAKFCCDEHKQRHWEKCNPGRRPQRAAVPSYNGNRRRRRANSRRLPTRYVVLREDGDQLTRIDVVSADRPERAKRRAAAAHDLALDELRTVPLHNLR
jgi:hypothetical protein